METKRNRTEVSVNAELDWYFNLAEGDMGLHAAPLEPSTSGGAMPGSVNLDHVKAAETYREIGLALGALDETDVRLLELAHRSVPPALRRQANVARLGSLAHVVMALAPSPELGLTEPRYLEQARRKVQRAIERFQAERERWKRETKRNGRAPRPS